MRTSTTTATSHDLPPQGGSGAMFDRIARRYDALNRILSLGIDRRWRRKAVAALSLRPGARVLDLAAGTADVGLEVLRRQPDASVVGLDPSPGMLAVGRRKVAEAGHEERVELRQGQAESLPFDDNSFDGVTIAFGIRNVEDRPRALREMARVARPGARVVILELSEPQGGLLAPLVRFHVHELVPRIGGWLSGAKEYRYLQQSIAAFPSPDAFAAMMAENGLDVLTVKPLTFGTCCLFVGSPAVEEGA